MKKVLIFSYKVFLQREKLSSSTWGKLAYILEHVDFMVYIIHTSSCEDRVEWYLVCLKTNQYWNRVRVLSFVSLFYNHFFINFSEQSMLALCQGSFFRSSQLGGIFFLTGENNLSKRKAQTKHSLGVISLCHLYRPNHPRYIYGWVTLWSWIIWNTCSRLFSITARLLISVLSM